MGCQSWLQCQFSWLNVNPDFNMDPAVSVPLMGCAGSWGHHPGSAEHLFMSRFLYLEDRFSCFLCKLIIMWSPFPQTVLEMSKRVLGFLGGLDITLQSIPTFWSHSYNSTVLFSFVVSLWTRTRMFVLKSCCPISVWALLPAILCSFSHHVNIYIPFLLLTILVCYLQQSLTDSTVIWL